MANFQDVRRQAGRMLTNPLVPIISRLKLTPDMMTFTGIILNLVAAVVIGFGCLLAGGIIFLLAGLFDLLDGALARYMEKTTRFGALLDSTADRITEGAIFLSLIFVTGVSVWPFNVTWELVLIFLALIGSYLTSYIRARAEGLNIDCTVGLFTRVERVIILALGLLLSQVFIALAIVVVLSFVTVGQRLVHVWRQARK
ncbi:MAG: CDP-alcohol phosphatidyltransferase family protein [Dehalococcoidia bacterium]